MKKNNSVSKCYRKNLSDTKDEQSKMNNLILHFSTRNFVKIWRKITYLSFKKKDYLVL